MEQTTVVTADNQTTGTMGQMKTPASVGSNSTVNGKYTYLFYPW